MIEHHFHLFGPELLADLAPEYALTTPGTIFNEVLDNDYTFNISHVRPNKNLDILINGNKTYVISYDAYDELIYEKFSVVSNKLNQPTE